MTGNGDRDQAPSRCCTRYHEGMKRLGELLLDRGAIDVTELHTALEACQRRGGRLGTQLLRFGFIEERPLLEALADQNGVPFVPESILIKAPMEVMRCVPADVLQRLQALPFERSRDRLRVAMANPRDAAALEELTNRGAAVIEPYVATEAAIAAALEGLGEQELEPLPMLEGDAAQRPIPEWEQLWQPPQVGPEELLRCLARFEPPKTTALLATYPDLTPVIDIDGVGFEEVLDEETFVQRLQDARHRDDVADLVVRYAERYLERVCLFSVHKNRVLGWLARGQSVVVDDVRSYNLPLDAFPIFVKVYETGTHFFGAINSEASNLQLIRVLGDPPPRDLFVAPIVVQSRPVAFLVGDNPGHSGAGIPTHELLVAANKAGVAFEILIMKHKIKT